MRGCPLSADYDKFSTGETASMLAQFRADASVVKLAAEDPKLEGYLITRREDIQKIVMDVETFSSEGNHTASGLVILMRMSPDKAMTAFNPNGRIEAISEFVLPVPAMIMGRKFWAPETE